MNWHKFYIQNNPIDFFETEKVKSIKPEILELALKYQDVHFEVEDDIPSEITDEVIDAIKVLDDVMARGSEQEYVSAREVKVAKYELQERYLKLLAEVSSQENLAAIRTHYYGAQPATLG